MQNIQCGRTALNFTVWAEWSLHILKNNNNKQHSFFCLSLGLLSSVRAWFLCCQRATIPMCVTGLPWLWVSAARALETRWGPEPSVAKAVSAFSCHRDIYAETSHTHRSDFLHTYAAGQLQQSSTSLNSSAVLGIEILFLLVQNR